MLKCPELLLGLEKGGHAPEDIWHVDNWLRPQTQSSYISYDFGLLKQCWRAELSDLANKNTRGQIKFEFHVHNKEDNFIM